MANTYVPKVKIALASSFEGIVNDGAPECALTSINAYKQMHPDSAVATTYRRPLDPTKFREHRMPDSDPTVRAFLLLRPVVEIAEDYHTVLRILEENPSRMQYLLEHPDEQAAYDFFIGAFSESKDATPDERAQFKTAFYDERTRLKDADYNAWAATQRPYPNSIRELRKLVGTQTLQDDVVVTGFVPWFATSKDEASTFDLCTLYTDLGLLERGDVSADGTGRCIINRARIIGKETTRDKLEQMNRIAEAEDLPKRRVFRVNDRYDPGQQQELLDNGFHSQVMVTGGYVFPHDIQRARNDPMVVVVERDHMAEGIAEQARIWGF